tara:strand:- start:2576 stop:2914 length:339 start_codon:yes stop_codon:yes gene_type:complete
MEEEIDIQFMEDLNATLSSLQELGCEATIEEFETWYNANLESIESTGLVLEGQDTTPVSMEGLFEVYEAYCFGESVDIDTPEVTKPKEEEKSNKLGMYVVGAAVLYMLFKKK